MRPTLLVLAGLLLGCAARPPAPEPRPATVTLLYFADLHAQLEEHPELFWRGGQEEIAVAGGLARIAAAAGQVRAERPGTVLLLDAGDTLQGTGAAAWTEGAAIVGPLNALRLDAAVPGNWEVAYGVPALKRRALELEHPLVAANVFDAATGERAFRPYVVRELANGVRVGVIGFTDPDVPLRQPPGYSAGLRYAGEELLPELVREVRVEGRAHVVVLLAHVGLPKAVRLAEALRGVDVVLSSDTHERTYRPIVRGQTWIVEPGAFGSFLGRLDLTLREGRPVDKRWELIELRADRHPEDPRVRAAVDRALGPHRERLERIVGETSAPLYRYAVAETRLDQVLADALREAAGAEIALSNGFRFGFPVPAGPIREADLWTAYPTVTRLKVGTVTGRQLREFWERELENVYASDPARLFGGWLPRPSGMSLTFAAKAPAGQRLREIKVGGRPLEDERRYRIVACEREGDAESTLCRIPDVADAQVLDLDAHEAVRRYLARHRPLAAPRGGRVVAVDQPAVVRSQFLEPEPGPAGDPN